MVNVMRKIILFMLLALSCMSASAQSNPLDSMETGKLMKMAAVYKYGINHSVNPKKAAKIYAYLVTKRGDTKAMYQLGKMFLTGDGVERNYEVAYNLFSRSAKEGYTKSFNKMALMHQKGMGRPVNVRNAFILYKRAADAGNVQGCYGVGYLLYKGLGVRQNYAKAVEYLQKGAAKNHAGCSFLLGSHFASGYDGTPDYEKAAKYFELASKAGHGWTIDITKLGVLDSLKSRFSRSADHWTDVKNRLISASKMRNIENNTDLQSLEGSWTGRVYTYDWSKTRILEQKNVSIDFEPAGDSVAVKWYENDSLMTTFTPERTVKGWVEHSKKEYQKDNEFVIVGARFEKTDKCLYAYFRQLNTKNREYRKPMFAVLTRQGDVAGCDNAQGFSLTRAAFASGGTLNLTVTADAAQTVNVSLCSVFGTVVKNLGEVSLADGDNNLEFNASLLRGVYVVKVSGNCCVRSKTVTYK